MKEYWYLWLIFAGLVVITAIVMVLAGKAVSSHNSETKKTIAELERLTKLKEKFKNLTAEKVENADSKELLEGVTAVLQAEIEKADDDEAKFESFNNVQKNVYVLNCFVADACENLSAYFDDFTQEFAKILLNALKQVGADDLLALAQRDFEMIDENNEEVSYDRALLKQIDDEFSQIYSEKLLLDKIKMYISDNIDKF